MPELMPTGHKHFDEIAKKDYVGTGNVLSNIQISTYVRSFKNVDCNGFDWKEGDLQKADLEKWSKNKYAPPKEVINYIKANGHDDDMILYMFFHRYASYKDLVVHGYVLTKGQNQNHALMKSWVTGPTYKSEKVIEECVKVVSTKGGAA